MNTLNRRLPFLLLLVAVGACFTRPGDRYPCASANQCPPLNLCLDGYCRSVFDPYVPDAGAVSSSSSSTSSSSSSSSSSGGGSSSGQASSSSSSGMASSALPPPEACQPLNGCQDGGCAFAVDISVRDRAGCARMSDGTVQCWGRNGDGELSQGTTGYSVGNPSFMLDRDGGVLHDVVQVERGEPFTCVVFDGGRMGCAGQDFNDTFGPLDAQDGGAFKRFRHLRMNLLTDVKHISAGYHFMCANTGTATQCFGDEDDARLGTNLPADVVEMTSGTLWTLARRADGRTAAWGDNDEGQLGMNVPQQNGFYERATAAEVPGVGTVTQVSAGEGYGCAVTTAGTVKCWGIRGGHLGRLDGGTFADFQQEAATVPAADGTDFGPVESVSAADQHTCAVMPADRSIWCWGANDYGQMGSRVNTLGSNIPVRAGDKGSWSRVDTDDYTTCGLNTCGQVFCWGRNEYSLLGGAFGGGENGTDEPQRIRLLDPL